MLLETRFLNIRNFRLQIQLILKDSPSLNNYLQENFIEEYQNGRKLFLDATGMKSDMIPAEPCFKLEQVLDENWLPQGSFLFNEPRQGGEPNIVLANAKAPTGDNNFVGATVFAIAVIATNQQSVTRKRAALHWPR